MNRYLNPIDNVNIHFETVIESEPPRNRNIQAVIKHKVQKDEKSKNGLNTGISQLLCKHIKHNIM